MAKQVRKTVRAVRKTVKASRKHHEAPVFRSGSAIGRMYAALRKGATVEKLVRITGMTEGTVRSYFPFFVNKYGVKIERTGERGASVYFAD
jgi:hypothetical protein